MLETLQQRDQDLLLLINRSGNTPLDPVMLMLSEKWVWIPLYGLIVYFIILKEKKHSWLAILFVLIAVCFADFTTSAILKPLVERWRPCRDSDLILELRMISECTGKFGFASSHAANTATLAIFTFLFFDRNPLFFLLIIWSIAVGYSRIYLGAHFPTDVLAGWFIGAIFGYLAVLLYQKLKMHF